MVSETRRTMADGRELAYEQRLVQRPPDDRLVIGAGSASGRVGGDTIRCTTVDDRCRSASTVARPPTTRPLSTSSWRRWPSWWNRASACTSSPAREDGCYHLELRLRVFTPPYGIESTFCFDDEVGVLREVEVVRPEATDRTTALEVRDTVTDADLRAADLGDPLATE